MDPVLCYKHICFRSHDLKRNFLFVHHSESTWKVSVKKVESLLKAAQAVTKLLLLLAFIVDGWGTLPSRWHICLLFVFIAFVPYFVYCNSIYLLQRLLCSLNGWKQNWRKFWECWKKPLSTENCKSQILEFDNVGVFACWEQRLISNEKDSDSFVYTHVRSVVLKENHNLETVQKAPIKIRTSRL